MPTTKNEYSEIAKFNFIFEAANVISGQAVDNVRLGV